jgi:uncharacterized protein (TIGR02001 family)
MIRKLSYTLLSAALFSTAAFAQTAAPTAPAPAAAAEPTPEHTFAYNIGLFSHYAYRGLTQTNYKPALQGGVDYSHSSGLYAGVWASNVSWVKDFQYSAKKGAEIDLYFGYKGSIADFSYDVGFLRYEYTPKVYCNVPGTVANGPVGCHVPNTDSNELYIAGTYKVATLKYSRSLTTLFGTPDSKGSGYYDLTVAVPLPSDITLTAHIGRQAIAGTYRKLYSYNDYKLEVAKDFGSGFSAGAGVTGTNASKVDYTAALTNKFTGKTMPYAFVKYTF